MNEHDITLAIEKLLEEGSIVIIGYNENGEAMYATPKQAEKLEINTKNNLS